MQKQLAGRYETKHFIIHYPLGGAIERDIVLIGRDHEFRYRQVTETLATTVPGKIRSYYFQSRAQKFRLFGARNVDMAKPWRREIYVHHAPFPHRVLRHEIAHVVAGSFGDPLFGVSVRYRFGLPLYFNVGLIEGIAVAADWPARFALTPHQSVKAMIALGLAPKQTQVFSTAFLSLSSSRGYTLAGSFVRYLLDTYGAKQVQQLYTSAGDFQAAFQQSAAEIYSAWQQFISTVAITEEQQALAKERFRRRGIFHRPCPHAVARSRARASALARQGNHTAATPLRQRVCQYAPAEPLYRLELAHNLYNTGEDQQASEQLQLLSQNETISSSLRATSLIAAARIAKRAHDLPQTRSDLETAIKLPISRALRRTILALQFALDYDGPGAIALQQYLWPQTPQHRAMQIATAALVVASAPKLGLGAYLLARVMRHKGHPQTVKQLLLRALALGLPNPLFTQEAAKILAQASYQTSDFANVHKAAELLSTPDLPQVDQLLAQDWLARITWHNTTHP